VSELDKLSEDENVVYASLADVRDRSIGGHTSITNLGQFRDSSYLEEEF
jgi:hypothetical protein